MYRSAMLFKSGVSKTRNYAVAVIFSRQASFLAPQSPAIVYQKTSPLNFGGIFKPAKPGGYSDSGADIAYSLKKSGLTVITPEEAKPGEALSWVFPDTSDGIRQAIHQGANVIWTNVPVFSGHPIEVFAEVEDLHIVGQSPALVSFADDKYAANSVLRQAKLDVAPQILVGLDEGENCISTAKLTEYTLSSLGFRFPLVIKPIRGRGSEGVHVIPDHATFRKIISKLLPLPESGALPPYGNKLIVEKFLPGQEVTITVMPPGEYCIQGSTHIKATPWALRPVERFNHQDGIAPYNGVVAVTRNSRLLDVSQLTRSHYRLMEQCEIVAKILVPKAPIRIDARSDPETGITYMFDTNLKPNMTGPGRPGRGDQDSLVAMAARGLGWTFDDLVLQMLQHSWPATELKKYSRPVELIEEINENVQNSRSIRHDGGSVPSV